MPPTLKGWHKIIREMIALEFLTCVTHMSTYMFTCVTHKLFVKFGPHTWILLMFLEAIFWVRRHISFFYSIVKDGIFLLFVFGYIYVTSGWNDTINPENIMIPFTKYII